MTNWFVSMFFVLLGLVGAVGLLAGFNGEPWGWIIGIPSAGTSYWFLAYKYEGSDNR